MARILVVTDDAEIISEALDTYGRRDVYIALDNTVANRHKAEALGIDSRLNLVGSDADHDLFDTVLGGSKKPTKKSAPKSKKESLAKEVEAVVNEESKKVL
ncbi:MAG: hypothetical protein Unbinned2404contig1000_37 [Prokaryotic dsDNA virus sp.]|nr:MAG: hypothetical protein Unbinned2404contig1000_37 [Prokaryotic dsDNA virus sp.]